MELISSFPQPNMLTFRRSLFMPNKEFSVNRFDILNDTSQSILRFDCLKCFYDWKKKTVDVDKSKKVKII